MQAGNANATDHGADGEALTVFCTNSMQGVLRKLIPRFEQETGYKVNVSFDSGAKSAARIAQGEKADVYIFNRVPMDEFEKQEKLVAGTRRDLPACGVGVAVRAGAKQPDIKSVEAFKRTLLEAKKIAYADKGNSGIHFMKVVEKIGLTQEVLARARTRPDGLIGDICVNGEADIAVQQIPELMAVPGLDIVGPLPRELQSLSEKSIAVVGTSTQRQKAQSLIEFLTSPAAKRVFEESGYEASA